MSNKWVQERFDRFTANEKEEAIKGQWRANAVAMFPAKFDYLKKQVQEDINFYNQLFVHRKPCIIEFKNNNPDGFQVSSRKGNVLVSKAGGTVISILRMSVGDDEIHDSLEVVPDFDHGGEIKFKANGSFLTDSEASERILSPIMC